MLFQLTPEQKRLFNPQNKPYSDASSFFKAFNSSKNVYIHGKLETVKSSLLKDNWLNILNPSQIFYTGSKVDIEYILGIPASPASAISSIDRSLLITFDDEANFQNQYSSNSQDYLITSFTKAIEYFKTQNTVRAFVSYSQLFPTKGLQVGAGPNFIPHLFNTDLYEFLSKDIFYMDMTTGLIFADNTFDIVYCEQNIEHFNYDMGHFIISEFYRVLKPGGILRLSTPDLEMLIDLYTQDDESMDYCASWEKPMGFYKNIDPFTKCMFFNKYFSAWGHKFLFDQETLEGVLKKTGFNNIIRCEFYKSDTPALAGLEVHSTHITPRYNEAVTMVLEATK